MIRAPNKFITTFIEPIKGFFLIQKTRGNQNGVTKNRRQGRRVKAINSSNSSSQLKLNQSDQFNWCKNFKSLRIGQIKSLIDFKTS